MITLWNTGESLLANTELDGLIVWFSIRQLHAQWLLINLGTHGQMKYGVPIPHYWRPQDKALVWPSHDSPHWLSDGTLSSIYVAGTDVWLGLVWWVFGWAWVLVHCLDWLVPDVTLASYSQLTLGLGCNWVGLPVCITVQLSIYIWFCI